MMIINSMTDVITNSSTSVFVVYEEHNIDSIKELVNASANSSVVFTPSITIAINQILQGIDFRAGDNVYYLLF